MGRGKSKRDPFSPSQIPQIAAGEYWLPGVGVSGSTTISWVGRNGTNTMTTASAQCPNAVTGPGGNPAWEFNAANSDIFTVASPSGPLTATDGVYVALWVRHDSLDTTNRTIIEQHGSAGARKWHLRKTASTSTIQIDWSDDGTNQLTNAVSLTEAEGVGTITKLDKYLFIEFLIDTSQSVVNNKTKLWINLNPITFTSQTGSGGAALFNGGVFRLGNNNFENQDFNGQVGPVYIGKRVNGSILPTPKERELLMKYLSPRDNRLQVILRGNSIMAGQGASEAGVTSTPGVLKNLLTSAGYVSREVHDLGLGGLKSSDAISNFFAKEATFVDRGFDRTITVFFEVRNSYIAGLTAQEIINEHITYSKLVHGQGSQLLICTAPPSDGTGVGEGVPGEVNAWLRANWRTIAEYFVDLELVPQYTPAGSEDNPTYYSDGVHGTDAMYSLNASKFFSALIT